MTLQEILPAAQRLVLLEALTRSVREDLTPLPQAEAVAPFVTLRGALKPDGPMPTDEELEADYVEYLTRKYA